MSSKGITPTQLSSIPDNTIILSQHGFTNLNLEGDNPSGWSFPYSATHMGSDGDTPIELLDQIEWFPELGATNMGLGGGTPLELSMADKELIVSDFPPLWLEHSSPTRSLQQGVLTSGLSNTAEKWTPDMEEFLMERKLQGDTLALIAKKMREKFGVVFVNPNILTKRITKIIERVSKDNIVKAAADEELPENIIVPMNSKMILDRNIRTKLRDCIVNQALTNATPHIIQIVQDEIERLSASNNDSPSEVRQGHSNILSNAQRDLKL